MSPIMKTNALGLSIILTAHREGLIAHKTVKSIERACAKLDQAKISYEILVSIDRGDEITISYFHRYQNNPKFRIFEWDFGDLAKSRNATIKQAHGKYIATIDADDLMSENWLIKAVQTLESKPYGEYVAHSEMSVSFEDCNQYDTKYDIIQKYGYINRDEDILLSVWAGRWNSVIVAPANFLKQYNYAANSSGFGYEDWHMSLHFIDQGLKNILIPETVIFIRIKNDGSEWQRQKQTRSVLHAHPVFKPSNFKQINLEQLSFTNKPQPAIKNYKKKVKNILKNHPAAFRFAKKALRIAKKAKNRLTSQKSADQKAALPNWLEQEWKKIHKIENKLFPPTNPSNFYHTITDDHYQTGLAYWQICQLLDQDSYDYALFVPWLIAGGADLFALNYANYLQNLGQRVIVIATNETGQNSTWAKRLNQKIPFVNFGQITASLSQDQKYRLLEQLIENLEIKTLHILNSALAYDFVRDHKIYLQNTNKKIIATAYNATFDKDKVFGFLHTHLPEIYDQLDLVTTDNQQVRQTWIDEYAFSPHKVIVHHQPFDISKFPTLKKQKPSCRILWASRLAFQKIPNIVVEISEIIGPKFTIDMYGHESEEFPVTNLKTNEQISYLGGFENSKKLPIEKYDLLLFTSSSEGMPNLIIEFALMGMPIVAASVGGLTDFIGKNGFLVNETNNPDAYAKQILVAYDNYDLTLSKAKNLQKQTQKDHTSANFKDELIYMLEALKNPSQLKENQKEVGAKK